MSKPKIKDELRTIRAAVKDVAREMATTDIDRENRLKELQQELATLQAQERTLEKMLTAPVVAVAKKPTKRIKPMGKPDNATAARIRELRAVLEAGKRAGIDQLTGQALVDFLNSSNELDWLEGRDRRAVDNK